MSHAGRSTRAWHEVGLVIITVGEDARQQEEKEGGVARSTWGASGLADPHLRVPWPPPLQGTPAVQTSQAEEASHSSAPWRAGPP